MVALVLVSHSPEIARGLVAMLAQAGPSVVVRATGGTSGGALGTSAPAVEAAVREALRLAGDGVLVLFDMNSAALAIEVALDALPPADRDRVRVSRGPLVEGASRAVVEAAGGGSLVEVLAASEAPGPADKLPGDWPADGRPPATDAPAFRRRDP